MWSVGIIQEDFQEEAVVRSREELQPRCHSRIKTTIFHRARSYFYNLW